MCDCVALCPTPAQKFDAGGGNDNMSLWAEAVNRTGREMVLESCNCGGKAGRPGAPAMVANNLGCPYNM